MLLKENPCGTLKLYRLGKTRETILYAVLKDKLINIS